jgi:hypothetical protein
LTRDSEVFQLKEEIRELSKTVLMLKQTVNQLSAKIQTTPDRIQVSSESGQYNVFANQASIIEYDVSWQRLVTLLQDANAGLTATELATRWGKSRSRTSEVLNKLVGDGHLVKFRDGRRIRFRAPDE